MPRALEPSEFLTMVQHKWRDELKRLKGKAPLFRCFDCKRWIPREELPLRCSECSGPNERVKRYAHSKISRKLVTQDAMVCSRCVDKHDHLRKMVLELQFEAYRHGMEKRATMKAMKDFAGGEILDAQGNIVEAVN